MSETILYNRVAGVEEGRGGMSETTNNRNGVKPLHMIIIDAWHPGLVERELAAGKLPALAALVKYGRLDMNCSSIFPTVTPACLTSLATGVGPDRHGITGVLWYNRSADRYVHYWPYPQSLVWGTISHVISDFFLRLNGEHLSTEIKTVFELLEEADVPSACINFPISRGPHRHAAEIPWFLRWLGKLPKNLHLPGPRSMRHGDMIRHGERRGRFFKKYGFNDRQSARYTAELVQSPDRPAFMLTYLNENDLRSHHRGPWNNADSLHRVDAELGVIMDAYGSWERAAKEARWIITGDHSQSNTYPGRPGHAVNVFKAFPEYRICPLRTGGLACKTYDFAVGPNDRMCYFYFGEGKEHVREEVIEKVVTWPSVDQVFWREGDTFYGYRRATGERMSWTRGGGLVDPFGGRWEIEGSLGAVDGRLVGNRIQYGDYPNALARVTEALSVPGGGSLILTATLGYEFTSGFPMGKGNHGSLHVQDTHVPLLTCGIRQPLLNPRTTDIVPMILRELGVDLPDYLRPVTEPHPGIRQAGA
ncbi:Type I phosphodiesterase / nucleotide pyrophosphatase [compost metagenome]